MQKPAVRIINWTRHTSSTVVYYLPNKFAFLRILDVTLQILILIFDWKVTETVFWLPLELYLCGNGEV
jgi:hypothetical protein